MNTSARDSCCCRGPAGRGCPDCAGVNTLLLLLPVFVVALLTKLSPPAMSMLPVSGMHDLRAAEQICASGVRHRGVGERAESG